jgi:hypothetical protein
MKKIVKCTLIALCLSFFVSCDDSQDKKMTDQNAQQNLFSEVDLFSRTTTISKQDFDNPANFEFRNLIYKIFDEMKMKSNKQGFSGNDDELLTLSFNFYFNENNFLCYKCKLIEDENINTGFSAETETLPTECKGYSQGKTVRSKEAAAAYIAEINKEYGGCSEIKIQEYTFSAVICGRACSK